jgi:hypothetical protein
MQVVTLLAKLKEPVLWLSNYASEIHGDCDANGNVSVVVGGLEQDVYYHKSSLAYT